MLGYVGYVALVVGLHWGFSLLPAVIILSIMVIPYIAKTTENSLRQVPTGYREGAEALGMSMGYGLRKVVLKSALPGIVTGLLLALAIACGETAPLIYTAGFSNTLPHSLTHAQFPYLTYVVFPYYNAPEVQYHYLSLRRRAHPRRHRPAPVGGQPYRRGPYPAPLRSVREHLGRGPGSGARTDLRSRLSTRTSTSVRPAPMNEEKPLSAGPEWGPLARLAGIWEGQQGEDVAYTNETGKIALTPYREHIDFKPFGPVENGAQVLYGLDYRMAAWRGTEDSPFHTEVGYWMWDARDSEVIRCFLIPRGSAIVAGAIVPADATTYTLKASFGSQTYGILSNNWLDKNAARSSSMSRSIPASTTCSRTPRRR